MPSLGGGGKYGGSDPSGGASKSNGGLGNSDNNRDKSSYSKDGWSFAREKDGTLRAVGMPSRTGRGTMTTAYGAQRGYMDNLRSGGLSAAWRGMSLSNAESPWNADYRAGIKNRIQNDRVARLASERGLHNQIGGMDVSPQVKQSLADAVNRGDLASLDAAGLDTSQIRSTHHSGGLLGSLAYDMGFNNYQGDDVKTISEAEQIAERNGLVSYDPETGTFQRQNTVAPVAGFGLNAFSPGYSKAIAEKVYSSTGSPSTAMATGKVVGQLGRKMGSGLLGDGMVSGLPGRAMRMGMNMAVPGAGALVDAGQLAEHASNLSYAGYTNNDRTYTRSPERKDDHYWLRYGGLMT